MKEKDDHILSVPIFYRYGNKIPLLVSKVTALPLATQSVDEVDVFNSHNFIYNQHLTPTQVRDLVSLMNEFSDCFASTTKHLGKTNVLKITIQLHDDSPVVYRP